MKAEIAPKPWAIKVGMLVSYDYQYVFLSLPLLYESADKIVLAIDKNRMTWSGQPFDLPPEFFDQVRAIDPKKKISFLEEDFSIPNLLPLENETRERTLIGEVLGPGGWHLQVDSDEYFVDFPEFCRFLHGLEASEDQDLMVFAQWLTLFKKDDQGWYFVDGGREAFPVATTTPRYDKARNRFGVNVVNVTVDSWVVHQSWARSEPEVRQKLAGWGHSRDFPVSSYLEFWKSINSHNARYIRDFHPLGPGYWPRLSYFEGDLAALMSYIQGRVEAERREREQSERLQEKTRFRRSLNWFVKGLLPPFLVVFAQKFIGFLRQVARKDP